MAVTCPLPCPTGWTKRSSPSGLSLAWRTRIRGRPDATFPESGSKTAHASGMAASCPLCGEPPAASARYGRRCTPLCRSRKRGVCASSSCSGASTRTSSPCASRAAAPLNRLSAAIHLCQSVLFRYAIISSYWVFPSVDLLLRLVFAMARN